VITTDRAKRTLETLLQRRDQVAADTGDRRQRADDALERLAAASAAIDEAWADGARRVEELRRQAERVRDEVRERTARLEARQARAVLDLAQLWPADGLALLLGMSADQVEELIQDAEEHAEVPSPRSG
jgi:DNA repair exonuclease SbcCD ATPase subunit